MKSPTSLVSRTLSGLSALCCSALLLIYLVYPMRSFRRLLGDESKLSAHYAPLLFLLGLSTLVFFLTSRLAKPGCEGAVESTDQPTPKSPGWLTFTKIVLSAVILGTALLQTNAPLEYDEHSIAELFREAPVSEILNPFRSPEHHTQNTNQGIATALSFVSYQFFGMSKAAMRAPALLTLAGILVLLFFFTRHFAPLPIFILYVHLAANQVFLWYAHLAKGYVYTIFFSLAVFWLIEKRRGTRRDLILYTVCFLLTILSHTFGAVLAGATILALTCWLTLNRSRLPRAEFTAVSKMLTLSWALVPVILFVFYHHFKTLQTNKELFQGATGDVWSVWGYLLGVSEGWYARLLLLLVILIGWARFADWKKQRFQTNFLPVLLFISVGMIGAAGILLQTMVLYSRLLLGFLIPLALWLTSETCAIRTKPARPLALTLLITLVWIGPLLCREKVYDSATSLNRKFDRFITESKTRLQGTPVRCIRFHGQNPELEFAKTHILKRGEPETDGQAPDCERQMVMMIATPLELSPYKEFMPLYHDDETRSLLMRTKPSPLAARS